MKSKEIISLEIDRIDSHLLEMKGQYQKLSQFSQNSSAGRQVNGIIKLQEAKKAALEWVLSG